MVAFGYHGLNIQLIKLAAYFILVSRVSVSFGENIFVRENMLFIFRLMFSLPVKVLQASRWFYTAFVGRISIITLN